MTIRHEASHFAGQNVLKAIVGSGSIQGQFKHLSGSLKARDGEKNVFMYMCFLVASVLFFSTILFDVYVS